jgi:hypothetical protein
MDVKLEYNNNKTGRQRNALGQIYHLGHAREEINMRSKFLRYVISRDFDPNRIERYGQL